MFKLKYHQVLFLFRRNLKEGSLYMFPGGSFKIYDENKAGNWLDTNPFTASLGHEQFFLKEICNDEKNLVRGNFFSRPLKKDFYIEKSALERRGLVEMFGMAIFYIPYCWIKNNFFSKKDGN